MEDGRSGLPRPPRRVPAGAGTLTQLEAPTRPTGPTPPPRGPWIFGRILAGLLVLIVIVAAGASAGWYVRQQLLQIDTDAVLQSVRPAVVRVLATTCGGSGEGTGVLIDGGQILTAASVVGQPLGMVVVLPDGRIRRANLIGTSTDGVAVLQPIGQLEATPVQLAAANSDPKAERALVGYTATGKQVINPIGSTADPEPLSTVMNAEKLGGPVVDRSGRLDGLIVGDTVQASAIVDLDTLRRYVAPTPTGLTIDSTDACDQQSRGPQRAVVPELQVGRTPLASEVQKLLGEYLTLENKRDFPALQALYSKQLAKTYTVKKDQHSHQTTYFFAPKLSEVSSDGSGGAYARLTFNALFSPTATGAEGRNCNHLDYRYRLIRDGAKLVIDTAVSMTPSVPCDTD
ncbi:trypsin-like peptidase [Kribbella sp. VKM Ac-2571]|uniref:trypsin-like peptidase domain-containing protein n=1 Tax=Kribbella sp. VKM Ac-2571 TaxID=2512222 RepID=UPI00105C7A1F|nr:trypsin-like peptidase domain-containing protein [Kribbella sp. VKM Ac-2571]TDO54201.1 trypsin-like peptidase [Kribbella sp. VKM Ac-2571]